MKRMIILFSVFILLLILATASSIYYKQSQLPTVEITIFSDGKLNGSYYDYILPIESIHKDAENRNYILLVNERDGAWGKEYFCESRYVCVLDSDKHNVALKINKGLQNPVIVSSNPAILNGSEVKIKGEKR